MADTKLVGENYSTPELRAKVTGRSKYAEDFRAEGMLFARLALSPYAHARISRIDASAALAMAGVKAILTADDRTSAGTCRVRCHRTGARRHTSTWSHGRYSHAFCRTGTPERNGSTGWVRSMA
jgi:CO/xanthine dehydrogenase Mo-binding subunit